MGYSFDPIENRRNALLQELNSLNMASAQNTYAPNQAYQYPGAMPNQNAAQRPQQFLLGRIVGSVDELNSVPCPTDGSVAYFPCPSNNEIYARQIGNDGRISTVTYVLKPSNPVPTQSESMADSMKPLEERIKSVEERITALERKSTNE